MKLVLGIDIGGTNTVFGLVNEKGEILFKDSAATRSFSDFALLINHINQVVSDIILKSGFEKIAAVGVGAPNGNATGIIQYAPNLPWKGPVAVSDTVSSVFNCDCRLNNDANLAATGEKCFGIAKRYSHFLMVTLGTGLGSGLYINNQLYAGFDGYAGELGNIIVIRNGRRHWAMDIGGCLEAYVSATGMMITAREILANDERIPSLLRSVSPEKITTKLIFEAAASNDNLAIEVVQTTAGILGMGLANYILINSPEAIVLFGGIAGELYKYRHIVEGEMNNNLPVIFRNKTELLLSSLPGADAALLGAASQVI